MDDSKNSCFPLSLSLSLYVHSDPPCLCWGLRLDLEYFETVPFRVCVCDSVSSSFSLDYYSNGKDLALRYSTWSLVYHDDLIDPLSTHRTRLALYLYYWFFFGCVGEEGGSKKRQFSTQSSGCEFSWFSTSSLRRTNKKTIQGRNERRNSQEASRLIVFFFLQHRQRIPSWFHSQPQWTLFEKIKERRGGFQYIYIYNRVSKPPMLLTFTRSPHFLHRLKCPQGTRTTSLGQSWHMTHCSSWQKFTIHDSSSVDESLALESAVANSKRVFPHKPKEKQS